MTDNVGNRRGACGTTGGGGGVVGDTWVHNREMYMDKGGLGFLVVSETTENTY